LNRIVVGVRWDLAMSYQNRILSTLLQRLDLGSSVAESDTLLESARIETSAFADLLNDRVDLVPGTKGSGKSALFRISVDFLPETLLRQRKVVVAHGIQSPGDPVFHAFTERFVKLSEEEFVSFWCIYLVSLAHEQFIKGPRYREFLGHASAEIERFQRACAAARIPDIRAKKSLKEILEWSLHVLASWRPKLTFKLPDGSGDWELDLFGTKREPTPEKTDATTDHSLPQYVNDVKESLEAILKASQLSLWLMVDRLDEIFPRRSDVERTALRGILRAMRYFSSPNIRVKVFLRDDMLEQVVKSDAEFTALTHVTVRQADTLRWTEDQILAMVVKRFFANDLLLEYLDVNRDQLEASPSYRKKSFDKIFPQTVFKLPKQSPTIRWIFNRCADGRGVVTPRDVLDRLIHAKQRQEDIYAVEPEGTSDWVVGAAAIKYGFEEFSKRKRLTYLQAEFPHLWKDIEKFSGGKTDYSAAAIQNLLGGGWKATVENLADVGSLSKRNRKHEVVYTIPFLYRHGMDLTQGTA
jgi:hypothetical protein